jgi:endonuclease-3
MPSAMVPGDVAAGRPPSAPSPYLRGLLADRAQHVDAVRRRLFHTYGRPASYEHEDPLSGLIGTILSQHTSDQNSHRAYASLRGRFPTWAEVAEAPVHKVEEAIRCGGLAAQKAPRIQHVLRAVRARFGAYDLSALRGLPRDEARALLMSLGGGIGPKTASCVLLFSLGVPAFCVDTHIQRICWRLGLIKQKDSAEKAQHLLEATVPADDTYAMHVDMIRHGREICRALRPLCRQCPLQEVCSYGNAVSRGVAT